MGAGYGHIMHPYEDKELTFKGLADVLSAASNGFSRSSFVWEKTDGINLMMTWKDGKPLFARNKTQMSDFGNNALDEDEIGSHFSSLPDVQRVISLAAAQLSMAMRSIDSVESFTFFQEGERFASIEVIHPDTPNVIRYTKPIIAIHGIVRVNDTGSKSSIFLGRTAEIDNLVDSLQLTPGKFTVIGQSRPTISPIDEHKTASLIKILESMNESNRDGVLVSDWARKKVKRVILDRMIQDSISMDVDVATRRLFDGDKDVDLRTVARLYGKDASTWLKGLDASSTQIKRQAMAEVHDMVIAIGSNILERSTDLISGKDRAAVKLATADAYRDSVKAIMNQGNSSDKARYFREMITIHDLGGIDRLPPMEGVIFDHCGKTYKLTGLFAPVHRVNSILKFKKEPAKNAHS